MNRPKTVIVGILLLILVIVAWAPWLTEEYSIDRVIHHLGGPDQPYVYLGETTTVGEVPKTLQKVPFGTLIYFPSEAVYIVTFFGAVI